VAPSAAKPVAPSAAKPVAPSAAKPVAPSPAKGAKKKAAVTPVAAVQPVVQATPSQPMATPASALTLVQGVAVQQPVAKKKRGRPSKADKAAAEASAQATVQPVMAMAQAAPTITAAARSAVGAVVGVIGTLTGSASKRTKK